MRAYGGDGVELLLPVAKDEAMLTGTHVAEPFVVAGPGLEGEEVVAKAIEGKEIVEGDSVREEWIILEESENAEAGRRRTERTLWARMMASARAMKT